MYKTHTPAFRTSLGGFNRADVNAYIAKLSRDFNEQNAVLKGELDKMKAQLEAAKTSEKLASEEAAVEKTTAENLSAELEGANNIVAAQSEQLEALKNDNERMSAELAELHAKLERFIEAEPKLAKYEEVSNRMGEIYMEASVDADRIRVEAKSAAEKLVKDTVEQCVDYADEVENALMNFAIKQKSAVSELFAQTQSSITAILSEFDEKSKRLAEQTKTVTVVDFTNKSVETK